MMITPIRNPYIEISLAKSKTYKNRLQGPIFPFVRTAITNVITNNWVCFISYEGDGEVSPGKRYVEIFTYGTSRFTGNELIRAYQISGTSTTDVEGFKLFRLDRIRAIAPLTTKKFKNRPLFSPGGDADMSQIFLQVQF